MKTGYGLIIWAVLGLSACALTPEQRIEQERQQKLYEQRLQVNLASQCDKETASLMQQQFEQNTGNTDAEKQAFKLRYVDKVADPMFQACYKLAWQNYEAQQRLRNMRYWYDDWYDGFYPYPFPRRFGW